MLQGSEGRVKRLHGDGASKMGFAKKVLILVGKDRRGAKRESLESQG